MEETTKIEKTQIVVPEDQELKEAKGLKGLDFDDKDLAMIGIMTLGIIGALLISEPTPVIMGGIAALGSLATGRKKE
jgi:hypothetical protein